MLCNSLILTLFETMANVNKTIIKIHAELLPLVEETDDPNTGCVSKCLSNCFGRSHYALINFASIVTSINKMWLWCKTNG